MPPRFAPFVSCSFLWLLLLLLLLACKQCVCSWLAFCVRHQPCASKVRRSTPYVRLCQSMRSPHSVPVPPADQVDRYLSYVLSHQAPSGWLGPDDVTTGDKYWGRFDMLLAMAAYAEANPDKVGERMAAWWRDMHRSGLHFISCVCPSGSSVFVTAYRSLSCKPPFPHPFLRQASNISRSMLLFMNETSRRMAIVPLSDWSAARGMDFALSIQWLLKNAPQGQEVFLGGLLQRVREQVRDVLQPGLCERMALWGSKVQACWARGKAHGL